MNQILILLSIFLIIYVVRKTPYRTWKFNTLTFFSLLIPGLGQYNRESYLESILWFVITSLTFYTIPILGVICWLTNAYFTGLESPIYLIPGENEANSQEIKVKKSTKKVPVYKILIGLSIILIGATLPFHYLPDHGIVLPKENFTFSNTFIFNNDVDKLIKRYNNANFFERSAINNEPLVRKLKEKGIIYDEKEQNQTNLFFE